MKKHKLKKSVGIFAMLALAVGLLAYSTVGGTRAALTYYSQTYTSQFEMFDIGITLLENGTEVHQRNYSKDSRDFTEKFSQQLLTTLTEVGTGKTSDKFEFGKKYKEELTVANTGTIDEYVRLTVRKYWVNADGKTKRTDLDPKLINVHFTNDPNWLVDSAYTDSSTERTTLIYSTPLKKGEMTEPATDWVTVDSAIKAVVSEVKTEKTADGMTIVTTTYTYNGLRFVVEAEAEGVQTHNAVDAIKSAWGRNVAVDASGRLSLLN